MTQQMPKGNGQDNSRSRLHSAVAVSPGIRFGDRGDGCVRFAPIKTEEEAAGRARDQQMFRAS